jgi:GFO/IDH/MocA C-terminal domain
MIHDLDMASFLLNEEPTEVYTVGSVLVDAGIGEAGDMDTAAVLLLTGSGAIAQIANSRRATYGYDQRMEAHGERGMLRAGNMTATTLEHASASGFVTDPALPFFWSAMALLTRLSSIPLWIRLSPAVPPRPLAATVCLPCCSPTPQPNRLGQDNPSGRRRHNRQGRH